MPQTIKEVKKLREGKVNLTEVVDRSTVQNTVVEGTDEHRKTIVKRPVEKKDSSSGSEKSC